MKYIEYIIIAIILLIIFSCCKFIVKKETFTSNNVEKLKFPFKNLKDQDGNLMNIIALTAPFRSDEHKEIFESYKKKGIPILGVTSYLNFPGKIKNKYEDKYHIKNKFDYINSCIGWLYCFRNPDSRGLKNVPKLEIAESDFFNIKYYKPNKKKEYDFIYLCRSDNKNCKPGWQSVNRNWELAKKCLPIMCEKFGLKGVLIGRINCDYTPKCKKMLTVKDFMKYWDFVNLIAKCKFIFVPNISDASPRVITEALCVDVPVLVNKNIYGGWKYVNEHTGEFFNDENDIEKQLSKLLSNLGNYKPREFYKNNYGMERSGKKLKKFVKKLYPKLEDCKYLKF